MIASLRGRLADVLPDGAVIDVGGVGYRVFLTPKALASLARGGEVLVHTVTYVREDALALYGFLSADERHVFEQLLGAGGVGPKLALALLSVHSPDALRRAVNAGDADALTLVPGIGRKGAARLILELKGKFGDGGLELPSEPTARPAYAEVREALAALGYAPTEVKTALESLPDDAGALPTEELLRLALRSRGTPRIANRLLRRVRDFAEVRGNGHVDAPTAEQALDLFEVDRLGVDKLDLALLKVLCERYAGQPVGLTTLAVSVGEEPNTVEDVAEPYLIQLGFMQRTPRGRVASAAAYAHLGRVPPRDTAPAPDALFDL